MLVFVLECDFLLDDIFSMEKGRHLRKVDFLREFINIKRIDYYAFDHRSLEKEHDLSVINHNIADKVNKPILTQFNLLFYIL